MPIPGLSRNDIVAIQNREMRTEARLEKALAEITKLKAKIKELKNRIRNLSQPDYQAEEKRK